MNLQGKKILITGASGGIGAALASTLSKQGAVVGLHYGGNASVANALKAAIEDAGGQAHVFHANFKDPQSATHLGKNAWRQMGGIDFLINNAGVSYKTNFLQTTEQEIDHFLNINFKSTFLLTQAVVQEMVAAQRPGGIFSITSINALQPGLGFQAYGASKGAIESLMKGLALELAPHQITVNTLAIGAIKTSMNQAVWSNEPLLKEVCNQIPLNRLGDPEELAQMVMHLLSSGTYMTGATLVIDGGWTLNQGYNKMPKN